MSRTADTGFEAVWAEANGHSPVGDVGELLSMIEPEEVSWLWPGRIPLGKLTLVEGDPGTGKSALTTDLAARVSVGRPFPDGEEGGAGGVVICSGEDGLADTIRPRLDAARGDASKVLALATVADGDAERLISIPEDVRIIRRGIEQVKARLVVIDPLMAFLSGDVNSHRDQDVRRALAPLAKLAEETGAAVVVVRHLNKSGGGNALYRGGGSIGIIGAARSALLVAKDPEDDRRRVLASLKSNLAAPAPSLAFVLTEAAKRAVRVEWKGATLLDANTLLAAPMDDEERREMLALRDAVAGLLEGCGGSWEGTPTELHDLLAERDLAALPDRPDELTKRLLKLARTGTAFALTRGWRGKERVLRLHQHHTPKPPNGVGGVGGVGRNDALPNTTDTTNTTNTDESLGNGVGGAASSGYAALTEERMAEDDPDEDDHRPWDGSQGGHTPLSSDLRPGESATLEELKKRRRLEQQERAAIIDVLANPEYFRAPAQVLADYRNGNTTLDRLTRSILAALKIDFEECGRYRPLVEEALRREENV